MFRLIHLEDTLPFVYCQSTTSNYIPSPWWGSALGIPFGELLSDPGKPFSLMTGLPILALSKILPSSKKYSHEQPEHKNIVNYLKETYDLDKNLTELAADFGQAAAVANPLKYDYWYNMPDIDDDLLRSVVEQPQQGEIEDGLELLKKVLNHDFPLRPDASRDIPNPQSPMSKTASLLLKLLSGGLAPEDVTHPLVRDYESPEAPTETPNFWELDRTYFTHNFWSQQVAVQNRFGLSAQAAEWLHQMGLAADIANPFMLPVAPDFPDGSDIRFPGVGVGGSYPGSKRGPIEYAGGMPFIPGITPAWGFGVAGGEGTEEDPIRQGVADAIFAADPTDENNLIAQALRTQVEESLAAEGPVAQPLHDTVTVATDDIQAKSAEARQAIETKATATTNALEGELAVALGAIAAATNAAISAIQAAQAAATPKAVSTPVDPMLSEDDLAYPVI